MASNTSFGHLVGTERSVLAKQTPLKLRGVCLAPRLETAHRYGFSETTPSRPMADESSQPSWSLMPEVVSDAMLARYQLSLDFMAEGGVWEPGSGYFEVPISALG